MNHNITDLGILAESELPGIGIIYSQRIKEEILTELEDGVADSIRAIFY